MYNSHNTIVCYASTTASWFNSNIDHWYLSLNLEDKRRFNVIKSCKSRKQFLLGRILLRNGVTQLGHKVISNQYRTPNFREIIYDNIPYYKSISHSDKYVIVVVSKVSGKLGIDIEMMKDRDFLSLAEEYFSGNELVKLRQLGFCPQHFYQLWTAKEAYIKAESKKFFEALKLDFTDTLAQGHWGKAIPCHKLTCYQYKIDSAIASILCEKPSKFFARSPVLLSELP